jgi:two-component system chemotaxis sensor kinase CheA
MNPFSNFSAVRQGGSILRIFLCDDQRALRELMKDCLDGIFRVHSIDEGATGVEMVEAAWANVYDLILLDVDMPGMDGFQALESIRASSLNKDSIIVLLTGRTNDADIMRGIELGATAYITKPFDFDTIAESMAELFADDEISKSHLVRGSATFGKRGLAAV